MGGGEMGRGKSISSIGSKIDISYWMMNFNVPMKSATYFVSG